MPQLLRDSFMQLKRGAAASVDGVMWREYEEGLDERIGKLWDAVQSGRYRAMLSRRCTSPRRTASSAPFGIAALEEKTVQQPMVTVLDADMMAFFDAVEHAWMMRFTSTGSATREPYD